MKLNDIKEKRALAVAEMRGMLTTADTANRSLTTDEAARFEILKTEVAGLETAEQRAAFLADAERRMTGDPVTGGPDKNFAAECRAFSLTKAIASQLPNSNVDAGREREVSTELRKRLGRPGDGLLVPTEVFHERVEQRVTTTGLPVGGPGSNLIETDLRGDLFIDRLRAAIRVKQLGATVLTSLVGNVDIPDLLTSATAAWFAENTPIPQTDLAFGKVQLRPRHCGALTEYSRNMLLQSTPDIEQLVRNDFAKVLAEAIDRAAISGAGGVEPTGILTLKAGFATTAATWAEVLGLPGTLAAANVDTADAGWLASPAAVMKLRQTLRTPGDTSSTFIMSAPDDLGGYKLLTTNLVPSGVAIFANWSDLVLAYWSGVELLVNPYAEIPYTKGNVQVRAIVTADVAVRHIESFAVAGGWV